MAKQNSLFFDDVYEKKTTRPEHFNKHIIITPNKKYKWQWSLHKKEFMKIVSIRYCIFFRVEKIILHWMWYTSIDLNIDIRNISILSELRV